jgi:FtsZ-binding cell division protein ZapB
MTSDLFSALDERIGRLLEQYAQLKRENEHLRVENRKLLEERDGFGVRIDAILGKLEGI